MTQHLILFPFAGARGFNFSNDEFDEVLNEYGLEHEVNDVFGYYFNQNFCDNDIVVSSVVVVLNFSICCFILFLFVATTSNGLTFGCFVYPCTILIVCY